MGVAISAAWILGVTFYQRQSEAPRAQDFAMARYMRCAELQATTSSAPNVDPCLEKVGEDWDKWMNRQWGKIAYIALPPIAVG